MYINISLSLYIYIYIYIHTYTYIYIERERDASYKEVDERNRLSGERRRTDRYLGNWEEQGADFEKQWQARAVPALPRHLGGGARQLLSGACAPLELRSGAPRADAAPAAISAQ